MVIDVIFMLAMEYVNYLNRVIIIIIEILFLLTVVPVAIAGLFTGLACVLVTIFGFIVMPIIEFILDLFKK